MLDIDNVLINTSETVKLALDELCCENGLPKLKYISGVSYSNWSNVISKAFLFHQNKRILSDEIHCEMKQKIQRELTINTPNFNQNLANRIIEYKQQGHFCSLITNNSMDMVDLLFQLYPNFSSDWFDIVIADPSVGAKPSPNTYRSAIKRGPDNVDIIRLQHSIPGIFAFLKATNANSSKLCVVTDEPNSGLKQYVNKIAPNRDVSFTAPDWSYNNPSSILNKLQAL